jgi:periplasmic divalent cation tolerance protein
MKEEFILVLITCRKKEANKIANHLIKNKLCACINIFEKVRSIYWWKGKIVKDKECLLFCKTKGTVFEKLEKEIKKIHSYTVPEIISFKIYKGNKDYLKWLEEI